MPRHNGLWPVQGRNQDCRVPLRAMTPPGVYSTIIIINIYAGRPLRVPSATSLAPAGWRLSPLRGVRLA
jgi:hypothetical protein